MKIIFLDIDGVLVTKKSLWDRIQGGMVADPNCVSALNHITDTTGAKIVLSSSWRFNGIEEMRLILNNWGVKAEMIDVTPDLSIPPKSVDEFWTPVPRGREILEWSNKSWVIVESFVILDDNDDMDDLLDNLVQTEFSTGLLMVHAEKAINILLS